MKRYLYLFFLGISFSTIANTLGPVVAKVIGTGTYDDGSIFVFFDRQISSCSENSTRLDLLHSHPAKEQVLSIAMTAFVSGKSVTVHPGSCSGNFPAFDTVGDSFMFLTNSDA